MGSPGGSVVNNLSANAGDVGSIPGSGRSPGEENGIPSQYSCLGNPMDRGGWWTTVSGIAIRCDLATKQSNQIHMVVYVFIERNDCLLALILGRIMSCNLLIMATVFSQLPLYVKTHFFQE